MNRESLPDWRRHAAPLSRQQPSQPVADALQYGLQVASSSRLRVFWHVVDVERHHGKIRLAISWYPPERSTGDDSL